MAGSKSAHDNSMDRMFIYLANSTKIIVCTSSSPEGLAAASSNSGALVLASVGGTSYFSIGDYAGGRQVTISACSCDSVVQNGVAACVILLNASSEVSYVTTCTTQQLTAGNKANIGSWVIQIADPV